MTNNHVSKWDHRFVCCCYFGLLWLFLCNHFWAPLYQIQLFFHICFEVMTAAAYFFHGGREVSTQTTICDCTCQRTANYQQLAVAAVVSCSLQSCCLELHFKHACTHAHTHSGPGSYLPVSKPLCWGIATIFWWHEIPQFLNLGNTLHYYINK